MKQASEHSAGSEVMAERTPPLTGLGIDLVPEKADMVTYWQTEVAPRRNLALRTNCPGGEIFLFFTNEKAVSR